MQLEFNLQSESESELKLSYMQKQIDAMHESMDKVRKKLFAEMTDLKKQYQSFEKTWVDQMLKEMRHEETKWTYEKENCLFDVQEYQESIC